jgi:hypothetical protein
MVYKGIIKRKDFYDIMFLTPPAVTSTGDG